MSHLSFNSLHCAFISSIESFNNFNLAGYFLNKVVPGMSSHCYKKYAAFLPRKWLKTAYFCIEDVI